MTANKQRPLASFNDSMQSQLGYGRIHLPTIFKVTRRSMSKPQFGRREERNIEAKVSERTQEGANLPLRDWRAKFTEFMQATGQPSSAAHSQHECPSPEDQRTYVIRDQWRKAEPIYRKWPSLTTNPLSSDGSTALHLAVSLNRISFFYGLMDLMAPAELEAQNLYGNTAFFTSTSLGNFEFAQTMLRKNPRLAMIEGIHGANGILYPIHLAALHGDRHMLQLLCQATVLDDLQPYHIKALFFTTLKNNIFDVAYALLEQCPTLAASRNEQDLTPLHVLARKPQEELYEATGSCGSGHLLITRLWTAATFMEDEEMLDLISWPSNILLDAAKSGNIKILDMVIQSNPELLMETSNLIDTVVLSRQENVLIDLIEKKVLPDFLMLQVLHDGNNILHLAGKLPPPERFGSSAPHIQMERELLRFKEMETRVPTALKTMRNNDNLTPKDVFNREHAKLLDEAGVAAKDTANYGMLVATIIATIVFAASLAVPGHDVSPKADSSILQKKSWYIIFILSNTIALFSSSSSIIFFLSVLTSSWKEDAFISTLHVRLLTFGVTTLFVSTTAMVVAFIAACFLIFNHLSTWVAYLVAILGFLTVVLFAWILYALFGDLIRSFCGSLSLLWPANYIQRIKSHITVFVHMMKGLVLMIPSKLPKMCQMCQLAKDKKRLQEDNGV